MIFFTRTTPLYYFHRQLIVIAKKNPLKVYRKLAYIALTTDNHTCIDLRYKHLPQGKPLQSDALRNELKEITRTVQKRASEFTCMGSTQANENFNNIVASKAPKNRYDT